MDNEGNNSKQYTFEMTANYVNVLPQAWVYIRMHLDIDGFHT